MSTQNRCPSCPCLSNCQKRNEHPVSTGEEPTGSTDKKFLKKIYSQEGRKEGRRMISKFGLQNMDITFHRWELRNPDNVRLKLADPGSQGEAEISRMAIVFTMHHALWWCFFVRKLSSSWEAAGKNQLRMERERKPSQGHKKGQCTWTNSGIIIFMFERPTQICWNSECHKSDIQGQTNHLHLITKAVNFNQATHSISKMQPPYPWQTK